MLERHLAQSEKRYARLPAWGEAFVHVNQSGVVELVTRIKSTGMDRTRTWRWLDGALVKTDSADGEHVDEETFVRLWVLCPHAAKVAACAVPVGAIDFCHLGGSKNVKCAAVYKLAGCAPRCKRR